MKSGISLLCLFMFLSCIKGNPDEVFKSYFNAEKKREFTKSIKLLTSSDQKYSEDYANKISFHKQFDLASQSSVDKVGEVPTAFLEALSYEVLERKIVEDRATYKVKLRMPNIKTWYENIPRSSESTIIKDLKIEKYNKEFVSKIRRKEIDFINYEIDFYFIYEKDGWKVALGIDEKEEVKKLIQELDYFLIESKYEEAINKIEFNLKKFNAPHLKEIKEGLISKKDQISYFSNKIKIKEDSVRFKQELIFKNYYENTASFTIKNTGTKKIKYLSLYFIITSKNGKELLKESVSVETDKLSSSWQKMSDKIYAVKKKIPRGNARLALNYIRFEK